jgi:hypothetical protein
VDITTRSAALFCILSGDCSIAESVRCGRSTGRISCHSSGNSHLSPTIVRLPEKRMVAGTLLMYSFNEDSFAAQLCTCRRHSACVFSNCACSPPLLPPPCLISSIKNTSLSHRCTSILMVLAHHAKSNPAAHTSFCIDAKPCTPRSTQTRRIAHAVTHASQR